jgi:transcriptional regulator with XRE-family HTH domain
MGLTEDDLARVLGVTPDRITAYEAGAERMPAEQLVRLCEYFAVTIGYFFPAAPNPGTV